MRNTAHAYCFFLVSAVYCKKANVKCEQRGAGPRASWWINMGIPNLWPDSTSPWPLPFLLCLDEHFPFISDCLMLVVYPIFWSVHFSIQICPLMTDFLKEGQTVAPVLVTAQLLKECVRLFYWVNFTAHKIKGGQFKQAIIYFHCEKRSAEFLGTDRLHGLCDKAS